MEQPTTLPSTTVVAPPTKTQSFLMTTAFVLEHNLRRLIILALLIGFAVFLYGIRGIFEGFVAFLGSLPQLLVQLVFILFFGIAQFAGLMYFLSRPRMYTVTPDQP